jgi:hypothetical protein
MHLLRLPHDGFAQRRDADLGAPRSKSFTSSSSSSFLIATLSVGCETKQASAARPKWRSRATATM